MKRSIRGLLSAFFVAAVAIGGFRFPLLGFAVAALLLIALAMNFFKPRSFCSSLCPRGSALGFVLSRASRRKPLPPFMRSDGFKKILCGFMMFCVLGSAFRLRGDIGALGAFFWGLCVVSLIGGLVLGLFFKPRAWCAVCPMGTLQDTIAEGLGKKGQPKRTSAAMPEPADPSGSR